MDIIEAFFVTLGLDPSGFKKGTKEVNEELDKTKNKAEKTQKDIDAANKKVEDSYRRIRDSILEITAAVVAAVAGKQFVNYLTESDTAATKLATNVGATTQDVLALRVAFESVGASGEEAGGALRTVTKILEDLKNTGGSEALNPLQRAGLDIAKFRAANSQLERMAMLSDALKKMTPQDAQYWGQKAGFSEEAINLMTRGNEGLKDRIARMRELNRVSKEDQEATIARTEASARLHATFEGLGRQIVTELTPAIVAFQNAAQTTFEFLEKSPSAAIGAIGALVSVIGLLKGYSLVKWGASMGGALGGVATAAGTLLGRLSLVVAAITSVYEIWKLGKALFDWYDATHREGIKLSPQAQARLNAGELNGVTVGASSGLTRGLRNNNPGNLEYRGQAGSAPESGSGRFAAFGSMAEGLAALDDQLRRYMSRGTDTVRAIIGKYAPAGENNTSAYIDAVARAMGVSPDMHLSPSQAGVIPGLMRGIVDQENGAGRVSMDQIAAGMQLWDSRHGGGGGGATVNIGDVHMHTTASTMTGAGADFSKSVLHRYALSGLSNGGVN